MIRAIIMTSQSRTADFRCDLSIEGPCLRLSISGRVDEYARFPAVSEPAPGQIRLDLGQVWGLNSVGIREWARWLRSLPRACTVIYEQCPVPVVEQLNAAPGLLTANVRIDSFQMPYHCEHCNREIIASIATTDALASAVPSSVQCPGCDSVATPDVVVEQYLGFLADR
jgi:hypothetical protein